MFSVLLTTGEATDHDEHILIRKLDNLVIWKWKNDVVENERDSSVESSKLEREPP